MKICVIAPVVIPILGANQRYGGIELVVSLATEELIRRGHEVYLMASGDSHTSAQLVAVTPKAIGQGIPFDHEAQFNRLAYQKAIELKPDVIWDHTLAIHACSLKQQLNIGGFTWEIEITFDRNEYVNPGSIPVIQTVHGPAKGHLPAVTHALAELGQYFVTISQDQGRRFMPYVPATHYLGTIYNAVDTSQYRPDLAKKEDYFVWLGRFGMEKGAHIALEVAHRTKTPLKMAGKLVEEHERNYYDKFIKPNLQPGDGFQPEITQAEKAELFARARATLMTNLWPEPFGLVPVESMAAGTPVVGPRLGALPETVGDAGVLVPVDDIGISENETTFSPAQHAYVERIIEHLPELERVDPQRPRQRVEQFFSVAHNVDGYERAFAEAMRRHAGGEGSTVPAAG